MYNIITMSPTDFYTKLTTCCDWIYFKLIILDNVLFCIILQDFKSSEFDSIIEH